MAPLSSTDGHNQIRVVHGLTRKARGIQVGGLANPLKTNQHQHAHSLADKTLRDRRSFVSGDHIGDVRESKQRGTDIRVEGGLRRCAKAVVCLPFVDERMGGGVPRVSLVHMRATTGTGHTHATVAI